MSGIVLYLSLSEIQLSQLAALVEILTFIISTRDFWYTDITEYFNKVSISARSQMLFLLGRIAMHTGSYKHSIIFFKSSLKLHGNKDIPKTLKLIADCYSYSKKPILAMKYYEKSLEYPISQNYETLVWVCLACALLQQGIHRRQKAFGYIKMAEARNIEFAELIYASICFWTLAGNEHKAQLLIKRLMLYHETETRWHFIWIAVDPDLTNQIRQHILSW